MTGALPNLLILGAMKCATTTLHHALAEHPDVFMARDKELNFFLEDRNWRRGLTWYAAQFEARARVRGESSPNYSKATLHKGVAERIAATLPETRLIYSVRDPVRRAVSHYRHNVLDGRESRTLREALLVHPERNHYLQCSRYHQQLAPYLRHFPRRQLRLVVVEELKGDFQGEMSRLYDFLEIDPHPAHSQETRRLHRTAAKRRKTPLRAWLGSRRGATRLRRASPKPIYELFDRLTTRQWESEPVDPALGAEIAATLREDAERFRETFDLELPWSTFAGEGAP
ncbi:MAG: sulfotransferase [Acidobacteriota bacterium]